MATPRICSVDGCDKPAHAGGMCGAHYHRWRAHGDPLGGSTANGAPTKFLEEVALIYSGDDCLVWPFGKRRNGYGAYKVGLKNREIHQVVCERVHGAGRGGEEVAHSCGNRACCNPKHLRWATRSENFADKLLHGTHDRGERNSTAKVTESQVRLIRNMSPREAAEAFGISRSQAYRIQRRERWAWLE